MSRRPSGLSRRLGDGAPVPFIGSLHPKSRSSPFLSIGLVVVLLVTTYYYFYLYQSSIDSGSSCTSEIFQALPYLKNAYGDSMRKILHVGPDTCTVVSGLSREDDTEAWGVEPYDLDDADAKCNSLVRKGIVRVSDIKFPLPYRSKSFSLVIVSDALDYLSPKYLNKTLPELARVSSDGFIIFSGYPGQRTFKVDELSKFGRPAKLRSATWWIRFFVQSKIEENEDAIKKFELAAAKKHYQSVCQIFHLKSFI
ncbi:putative S-adenosyl-L-methionine-dependent methyltransferase, pectin methyltransferase CGR2/3 [Helianthus annuus]|nr:putative S-adenosyl-L-methionine-dependent methyltransferase, pectin methyltransferase CGR2/3 [Helianthus annuus]